MTVKSLIALLEKRKSDIQLKFQETSGIYSAKSSSTGSQNIGPAMTLSVDDRLRLFALENERLRALLKTINEQTEVELQVINSALLELNQSTGSVPQLQTENQRLKEEIRILEAKLNSRDLERNSLNDQMSRLESLLSSEKLKNNDLQARIDSLKRELDSAQGRKDTGEVELLFRQRIQQLEKMNKELTEQLAKLKIENGQLGLKVTELQTKSPLATPLKLELRQPDPIVVNNEVSERKIIEAINDTVKNELLNFGKSQKQLIEKMNEDKDRRRANGSQDPLRHKQNPYLEPHLQRSVYRNFPQTMERNDLDPHLDLSLNLQPDFDPVSDQPAANYKKLKQIVKLLTEKQQQSAKTLEEKIQKLKELKKANKELTAQNTTLEIDNKNLKNEAAKHDSHLRKAKEEADKLRSERDRLAEEKAKLQKKIDKLERKIDEMRDAENKIQSLEKQKELMMQVNNQRNAEVQSLLNELNEKQDALNHAVSRSQINMEGSQFDAETSPQFRAKYMKLKRLFLGLRDAYFQLQDEYAQLSVELEKEVKLRESILNDFLKRSDFFEQKITEFRDFHDRIIDVKRLIVSKKLDR